MEVEREDPVDATETNSLDDQELPPAVRECVVGETATARMEMLKMSMKSCH